jgi:alkanesulfonate monooxygenase SsuD/methylene tetrahydromethanopterin reductase-like flavin-dependent oxidoreductase (luciferase family)
MKVALMIEGQEDVTWDDWRGLATACEEHGIETLFRSDHYLSVFGVAGRGSLDAWATINALAAITTTLRLGTLVSPATFRHGSELAKVAVTADHVSRGRIELGLGTGWNEGEHEAYGFPFPPMGERMELMIEQLELIASQWSPDSPIEPKPVQRPRPNLILGGRGGPRSVRLAARYADEYNTVMATAEEVADIRRRLDEACEEEGRDPATLPLSMMTGWLVGADRGELVDRASYLSQWKGEGDDGEAFIAGLRESTILGTVEEAVEQLRELEQAGLTRIMGQHLLHRDLDAVALMGREVAPAVR